MCTSCMQQKPALLRNIEDTADITRHITHYLPYHISDSVIDRWYPELVRRFCDRVLQNYYYYVVVLYF